LGPDPDPRRYLVIEAGEGEEGLLRLTFLARIGLVGAEQQAREDRHHRPGWQCPRHPGHRLRERVALYRELHLGILPCSTDIRAAARRAGVCAAAPSCPFTWKLCIEWKFRMLCACFLSAGCKVSTLGACGVGRPAAPNPTHCLRRPACLEG